MDQLSTGCSQAIEFKWLIYPCCYLFLLVPLVEMTFHFVAKKIKARK